MRKNNDITDIIIVKCTIIVTNIDRRIYSKHGGEISDIADFVDMQGGRRDDASRSFVAGLVGRIDRGNVHNVRNVRRGLIVCRIVDVALPRLNTMFVTGVR